MPELGVMFDPTLVNVVQLPVFGTRKVAMRGPLCEPVRAEKVPPLP